MIEVRSGAAGDAVGRGWVGRLLNWGLQALLLVTAVCAFVPFAPFMPGQDLDESWMIGMNQAMAQGLAIGRDIVFTFGPYASIYTGRYHPDTDHLMVLGSLYLGLCFGLALILASRGRPWYLLTSLWVVLAGLMYSRDALFLAYPMLVAVFCFRTAVAPDSAGFSKHWSIILTAILFLPFGLLAAIKGTFLMLSVAIAALAVMLFVIDRRWHLALAVMASVGASTVLFWLLAGQSMLNLSSYFMAITEISAGYAEAMALPGVEREIVYFLIAAAVMLAAIVRERHIAIEHRAFLFLSFLAFLFLAFKGGFVRHDAHALLAGTSVLMGALMLAVAMPSRWLPTIIVFAILSWTYIDSHYTNTSTRSLSSRIGSTYSTAWQGIKDRVGRESGLREEYQATLKRIQGQAKLRLLDGTTDIYPHAQSQLIASGNTWNPRPIFQSYSAYTSALAIRNRDHLLDEAAPDNVIFRLDTLDGRVPSLDDGVSWAVLLTHYRPHAMEDDWLYLRKSKTPASAVAAPLIKKGPFLLGDAVPVPGNSSPVFAWISVRPTLLGKVMGVLFKPEPLQITLNLADGSSRTHRLVSGMAKAGFLISPLVQNTMDFGALYGGAEYLAGQEVTSFVIRAPGNSKHWQESFDVVFQNAATAAPMDIRPLFKFDAAVEAGAVQEFLAAERCEGGFDAVNGVSPAPPSFMTFGKLAVHGWLARSVKPGITPEVVFIVLSDDQGRNVLFHARKTARPDVGKHFNEAALDASGFAATIDVATVRGDFSLGLAYLDNGRIMLCPKSAIRGSFKGIKSLLPG